MPNCAQPGLTPYTTDDAWCSGWVPTDLFLQRVQDALSRIQQRGPECAKLAQKAALLLSRGTLRFADGEHAGWTASAPLGGNWAVFDRKWVDESWTPMHLDWIISHEMDHSVDNVIPGVTDDEGHLLKSDGTVNRYHTAHSRQCEGY
jgi:hypothetical protein